MYHDTIEKMPMLKPIVIMVCICIGLLLYTPSGLATGTTELQIVKYANDDTTILNETTVDYEWMRDNLAVYGDGVTHYYHQGPVFQEEWEEVHPNATWNPEEDKWNPEEDVNVLGKDMGAVKGTDVKDLCELVGGMAEGDIVEIKAVDGFYKRFPYETVYEPEPRQGPLVVTWYTKDASESGPQSGYVTDGYYTGMRLVVLADTSTNPWGKHVFGISDMKACLPEEFWHYYYQYPDYYPTTTGYTIKWINRILIHSSLEPPIVSSITVSPADVTLSVGETQQFNATAFDQNGNDMPDIVFSWSSEDEPVGIVDDTGVFEAHAAGTTTVSAANGTVSGSATVIVRGEDNKEGSGSGGSSAKITPTAAPTPTPKAPSVTKASRTVPALETGTEIAMLFEDMDVSLIMLTTDTTVSDVTVTVERVEKRPDIPEPNGILYAYLDITISSASAEVAQIGGGVEFIVSKSWIEEQSIDDRTITLWRYSDMNEWMELNTAMAGDTNTTIYFEANVPQFSLFAITGATKEERTSATPSSSPQPTATSPSTSPPTPMATPSPKEPNKPESTGVSVPGFEGGLATAGLVLIAYALKRREK